MVSLTFLALGAMTIIGILRGRPRPRLTGVTIVLVVLGILILHLLPYLDVGRICNLVGLRPRVYIGSWNDDRSFRSPHLGGVYQPDPAVVISQGVTESFDQVVDVGLLLVWLHIHSDLLPQ